MQAQLVADVAASRIDTVTVDSANVRVAIADGIARFDTLAVGLPQGIVEAKGTFQHKAEAYMLTTEGGVPGFEVVTPLVSADGIVALVDRGFVPESLKDPAKRPESQPPGEVDVTGLVRRHVGGRGPFTPDNDPDGNMWFWWDIPAMLAYADVAPDARVAPFVLHIQPGAGNNTLPKPVSVDTSLINNHLQYALTWFALAAVLVVMAGLLIRQTIRKGRA